MRLEEHCRDAKNMIEINLIGMPVVRAFLYLLCLALCPFVLLLAGFLLVLQWLAASSCLAAPATTAAMYY